MWLVTFYWIINPGVRNNLFFGPKRRELRPNQICIRDSNHICIHTPFVEIEIIVRFMKPNIGGKDIMHRGAGRDNFSCCTLSLGSVPIISGEVEDGNSAG